MTYSTKDSDTARNGAASTPSGPSSVGGSVRMAAISAVTNYRPQSPPVNFTQSSSQDIFGSNVFGKAEMKDRLPKPIYKSLMKTIEAGEKLDPAIADVVASAMKDWAIEKGATHYAHVFYPAHRPHRRKARQLPLARWRRRRDHRIHRQATDSRRARRFELPLRRHSRDVRSPRLHDLGRHQPRLHSGEPQRHDALHSDGVCLLDR